MAPCPEGTFSGAGNPLPQKDMELPYGLLSIFPWLLQFLRPVCAEREQPQGRAVLTPAPPGTGFGVMLCSVPGVGSLGMMPKFSLFIQSCCFSRARV